MGYLIFIDQLILSFVRGIAVLDLLFQHWSDFLSKADFLSPNALVPHLADVICFRGSQRAPKLLGGDLLSADCNGLS